MEKLEQLDAHIALLAELRVLWEMTSAEIGDVLGISRATADRDWRFARAWLKAELGQGGPAED